VVPAIARIGVLLGGAGAATGGVRSSSAEWKRGTHELEGRSMPHSWFSFAILRRGLRQKKASLINSSLPVICPSLSPDLRM